MKKLLLIIALIFTGCNIKTSILKKDPLYEKALKHTKRCQIINSFETKALLDVTYLNPIYKNFQKPTFLIGVYNDFDNTLNNTEFTLLINGKKPDINSTIPSYILYKNFPFYNSWMNYYIVSTDNAAPIIIEYKSRHWGECNLTF
ncbi:MAG: hypothetical protein ABGX25_06735 [Nautiliaceae bacterium]